MAERRGEEQREAERMSQHRARLGPGAAQGLRFLQALLYWGIGNMGSGQNGQLLKSITISETKKPGAEDWFFSLAP